MFHSPRNKPVSHITELSNKLSRTVGLFYKIRHYAPLEILKLLYYGTISFLSYGIHVWGITYSAYFDLIFVLQKKVLKSITFNEITSPAIPIFHNLELLILADIHNLQVVSFVYECVTGLSPFYFYDYFQTLSSTHTIGARQATMEN